MDSKFKIFALFLFGGLVCYLIFNFVVQPFLYPHDSEIKSYIMNNLVSVDNVDPNNLNFKDLGALEKAIGNSSVVFLGEQDHGEAPAFLAKTRIIKFLHQQMGFDVLVFESDFYGLHKAWERSANSGEEQYKENIYPIWTHCLECAELFNYINSNKNTRNELSVAGIDPRQIMAYSRKYFYDELQELVEERRLIEERDAKTQFFLILKELLDKEYDHDISLDQQEFFLSVVELMLPKVDAESFQMQMLKNLNGFARNSFDTLATNNSRDIQMADNLNWIINHRYKGKKVIFWGSNSHIFKNYNEFSIYNKYLGINDTTNMGTEAYKFLKEDLYILGFTSNYGVSGRLYAEAYEISKPNPNVLESWIGETDLPYAFVNFRDSPFEGEENRRFFSKSLIHKSNYFNWFNLFDGIFYIKEVYPCTNMMSSQ